MKIIKRNGAEEVFDADKIEAAITKANNAVEEAVRMTPLQIKRITEHVQIACEEMGRSPAVGRSRIWWKSPSWLTALLK